MGNCSGCEKGLKDETRCRDNAVYAAAVYFTSCNVLAEEHRPLPQRASLALFPQLHLWCIQSVVWELYINSWDYLAVIKIHKQAKCKFICSSQQNVSLISCVLVTAKEFWAVAFQGKIIGLQMNFPSRKLFSKWLVILQRFYSSICVFRSCYENMSTWQPVHPTDPDWNISTITQWNLVKIAVVLTWCSLKTLMISQLSRSVLSLWI